MSKLLSPQDKNYALHVLFWAAGLLGVGIFIFFILDIITFFGGGDVIWARAGFLPFMAIALFYISRKGLKKYG